MLLHRIHAVVWLFNCIIGLYAYPTIKLPYFFGPSSYGDGVHRLKKSGFEIQPDADEVELEHLKDQYGNEKFDATDMIPTYPDQAFDSNGNDKSVVGGTEPLSESQELERQLERMPAITSKKIEKGATTTTTELPPSAPAVVPENRGDSQQGPVEGIGMHRPPTLQHDNGGKMATGETGQQLGEEGGTIITGGGSPPAPSAIKPFYGAARLAFGQNPEVLPTTTTTATTTKSTTTTAPSTTTSTATTATTTSTSTTTTTTTTTTKTPSIAAEGSQASSDHMNADGKDTSVGGESAALPLDIESNGSHGQEIARINPLDKVAEEIIKTTAQRRSVTSMPKQTVDTLLKRYNGQITPFDMAQYVFWTGDEAGVARAVEELIDRGLMTRENALAFLREVRVGIEYLQQSYTNRIFPEAGLDINLDKKNFDLPQKKTLSSPAIPATNAKPLLPYSRLERRMHNDNQNPMKSMENASVWHKLQALNNDGNQDLNDYDETGERAKISEFLYNEYTLEDILYKLAKIMFTQSLSHGSDEAQRELQKLTDFLEREGNLGVIPIDLQKKVLHILYRALSDTLAERPELLSVANINLANPYSRLPMRTLEP